MGADARRAKQIKRETLSEIANIKAAEARDGTDVLRGGLMGDGDSEEEEVIQDSSDEDKDFGGSDSGDSKATVEGVEEDPADDVLATLSQKLGTPMSPIVSIVAPLSSN